MPIDKTCSKAVFQYLNLNPKPNPLSYARAAAHECCYSLHRFDVKITHMIAGLIICNRNPNDVGKTQRWTQLRLEKRWMQ
jgi:hypothetical protein